ncbi:uncharacterized protein LOC115624945 [Scaptodrosophila lebanonensis]|uniref:Uncharacterized protein LOC115624945 n=1 Tax=Drosophila lebanonensis TaxID=7225 RepID=A0A6J2TFZ9_DROLE|nr:uncharacterized protein LOC115624945 [Scaptodrosophila lebanonensis]
MCVNKFVNLPYNITFRNISFAFRNFKKNYTKISYLFKIMAFNPSTRNVVQISEEAAPAVHLPVRVGDEVFIMTQQDIRRVEDIRFLTYHTITPDGNISPIDTAADNVQHCFPVQASGPYTMLQNLMACNAQLPPAQLNSLSPHQNPQARQLFYSTGTSTNGLKDYVNAGSQTIPSSQRDFGTDPKNNPSQRCAGTSMSKAEEGQDAENYSFSNY